MLARPLPQIVGARHHGNLDLYTWFLVYSLWGFASLTNTFISICRGHGLAPILGIVTFMVMGLRL